MYVYMHVHIIIDELHKSDSDVLVGKKRDN